jgi:P pilus assembly chaperone PapD
MARRNRKFAKRVAVLSLFVVVLFAGTIAFAAWTTNGTGSGYVAAGSEQDLTTLSVAASATSLLYPNGSADVKVRINNPSPYKVLVTDIDGGSGSITSGDATCDASSGVTFTDQSGSWTVPASGALTVTLTNAASMSNASVDACQAETFAIPVDLTGASTP